MSNSGPLIIAGSETVATLLSGATYHLLSNPSVWERLQNEIRGSFQSEKHINFQSVGNPARMPYMEAVLTESLRLYPPVPASIPRVTGPEGDVIDGHVIPPNVITLPSVEIVLLMTFDRPPSAYIIGQPAIPLPTLPTQIPSSLNDGSQTHPSVTDPMTKPPYSPSLWDPAIASGRRKFTHNHHHTRNSGACH